MLHGIDETDYLGDFGIWYIHLIIWNSILGLTLMPLIGLTAIEGLSEDFENTCLKQQSQHFCMNEFSYSIT